MNLTENFKFVLEKIENNITGILLERVTSISGRKEKMLATTFFYFL